MKLKILSKHFRDYTSLQMCSLCFLRGFINFFKAYGFFVLLNLVLFSFHVCALFQSFQSYLFLNNGNSLSNLFCWLFYCFCYYGIHVWLCWCRLEGTVWLELSISVSPHSCLSKLLRENSFILLSSELNQE